MQQTISFDSWFNEEADDYPSDEEIKEIAKDKLKGKKFKYVIIECGYSDRLSREKIIKAGQGITLLFINEYSGKNRINKPFQNDAEIVIKKLKVKKSKMTSTSIIKTMNLDGVAFKADTLDDAFRCAEILMDFDHCGCFQYTSLYEAKILDDILVLHFDTESG